MKLWYLGPAGSFTHQAALQVTDRLNAIHKRMGVNIPIDPTPEQTAQGIVDHVDSNDGWGVIAWENNIEGVVVPNLDLLLAAQDCVGVMRMSVPVSFDAFVRLSQESSAQEAQDDEEILRACTSMSAHPHGLAQCKQMAARYGLALQPATSNAAACRDAQAHQVVLGPSICGRLYGLHKVASAVEDFPGAHTEFLVIAPRRAAQQWLRAYVQAFADEAYGSIIAFIPRITGAGVLANLLDVVRDAGLNMQAFMSRPLKGHDATYSFIATVDAATWSEPCKNVLCEAIEHGDWVRTLAVYPRQLRQDPPVDKHMLPQGGVCVDLPQGENSLSEEIVHDPAVNQALLWSDLTD